MVNNTVVLGDTHTTPFPSKALKGLSSLLELLTSTSIFLALNASIVAAFGSLLYGLEIKPTILLIAFLATFSVYNMNRVTDRVEDSINRPRAASRSILFFLVPSIIASASCLLLSASVGAQALSVIVTSFIASIFYSVKLSPSIPRLKEILGLKSVLVAFSWGFTGALLPASSQAVDAAKIVMAFTYIFIQILVNTILCDVRDMDGDRASGVKTLPLALGLSATKKLLFIVNTFMFPWLLYCLTQGLFQKYLPALFFGMGYGYLIIWAFSRKGCNRLLIELTVDGEWIPLVALMKLL
ncbi:MAG TPA: UbiA family prenyltransferase [Candidatus Krumholzibacteriaceae bacterium]|nr:UbiA family prenyltransferase [Candidatus Krumholzibacteriaceae bacterium]